MKKTPEIFRYLIVIVTVLLLFTFFSCGVVSKNFEDLQVQEDTETTTNQNSKSTGSMFSTTTNETDEYRLNYVPVDPSKEMTFKNVDGEMRSINAKSVFEKINTKSKTNTTAKNENETNTEIKAETSSLLDKSLKDVFKMGIPWYFWVILFFFGIIGIVVFMFFIKVTKTFSAVTKILPTLQAQNLN